MGGPENLKGGSVHPSIRPSVHPSVRSTLAQPIKSVCSYFLPIGSPVHPEGGRSDWSCELPSLITLDQLTYPGVSVGFKARDSSLENDSVPLIIHFCFPSASLHNLFLLSLRLPAQFIFAFPPPPCTIYFCFPSSSQHLSLIHI